MSTPVPSPDGPPTGPSGLRVGDLLTGSGAVVALVSTLLPFEKNSTGQVSVWHSAFLTPAVAVVLAVVMVVLGIVSGTRRGELVPQLGLTTSALAAVVTTAAALFYALSLITFDQLPLVSTGPALATAGPTLGMAGIVLTVVGSFGLALSAPGSGLARRLGGSAAPTVVQPDFGQFAPGGPQPAPGVAQQPFAPQFPPSAPTVPGRTDDTIAGPGLRGLARPAQAATFAPYWAGVTSTIPAFSPADADHRVGEVTPGQWYLVTGAHPVGLLVDLRGRPVLVRDVAALVRG